MESKHTLLKIEICWGGTVCHFCQIKVMWWDIWWQVTSSLCLLQSLEGEQHKHSPNFNIKGGLMIARHIEETEIQMNLSACDKTTWVLVKDELWLFLENEVLSLATGQTLNSRVWNYLKRRPAWCTWHLSLKECLFVHSATDLHQRKPYKRTGVFVNPFVKN